MKLLVTGGAGFIGSAFIRLVLGDPTVQILNVDKLTYAGNLDNLRSVENNPQYAFVRADVADRAAMRDAFEHHRPETVVHFAAESHVDRSILNPQPVFDTNLAGTFTLLETARAFGVARFVHVSTDEVYGSIETPLEADEAYPLKPSSPYSASKAGSDLLALSYFTTYRFPVVVTRASNNYGPYQFPEKLLPLMISNALQDRPLPVYGDGQQIRDWLYVDDHCRAILAVLGGGRDGQIYNIGGSRSLANLDVIGAILSATGKPESLIQHVGDRPGHDRRYALSSRKIMSELQWAPLVDFEDGLRRTIRWYQDNEPWLEHLRTGEYQRYYAENYGNR